MKKTILLTAATLLSANSYAYKFKLGEDDVNIYASFRIAFLGADGAYTLEDRSSRGGFKYTRQLSSTFKAGLHGEYAINTNQPTKEIFFKGDQFQSTSQTGPFANRLGYVFLESDKYGKIQAGKQWSTFYDVVEPTDYFWVFGGEASSAYSLSSDGGLLGTGRADNAITYRKTFNNKFSIGAQYQPTGDKTFEIKDDNDATIASGTHERGYGASLGYTKGFLKLQAGFTRGDFTVSGRDTHNEVYAASLRVKTDTHYFATVYSIGDNAEFDNNGILFESHGLEVLYAYFTEGQKLHYYGGANYLRPEDADYDKRSENKYKVEKYILGVAYKFKNSVFAIEGLHDESRSANGEHSNNSVVAALLRIDV